MDSVMQADVNETVVDQRIWDDSTTAMNKCNTDLSTCLAAGGACQLRDADVADKRTKHDTCRVAEDPLNGTYLATRKAFEDFASDLNTNKPACIASITFDTSDSSETCLENLKTWAVDKESSFKTHKSSTAAAKLTWENKRTECNSNQTSFESSVCLRRNGAIEACNTHSSCISGQASSRATLRAELESSWGYRNASYMSAAQTKCYIQV